MATIKELEKIINNRYVKYFESSANEALKEQKETMEQYSNSDKKYALNSMCHEIWERLRRLDTDIVRQFGRDSVQYGIIIDDDPDESDAKVLDYLNYDMYFSACNQAVRKIPSFHALKTIHQNPIYGGTYQFTYSYPVYSFEIVSHIASHKESRGTGKYEMEYSSYDNKVHITEETKTVRVDDSTWTVIEYKQMIEVTVTFKLYAFKKGGLEELERMIADFNKSEENKTFDEYKRLEKGNNNVDKSEVEALKTKLEKKQNEIQKNRADLQKAINSRNSVHKTVWVWGIVNLLILALYVAGMIINLNLDMIPIHAYVVFTILCIVSIFVGICFGGDQLFATLHIGEQTIYLIQNITLMWAVPMCSGLAILIMKLIGGWFTFGSNVYMRDTVFVAVPLFVIYIISAIRGKKEISSIAYAEDLVDNEEKLLNKEVLKINNSIKQLRIREENLAKAFSELQKSEKWKNAKRRSQEIADFYCSIRL